MPIRIRLPPSKARNFKRASRRRFKRRMSRVARRPTGMSFLPPVFRTRLRYQQYNSLTSTTNLGTQVIRANSLFDPNLTGAGHQPRGYDELSVLYNEYRVFGVFVDVSFKVTTGNYAWVGYSLVAHNVGAPTTINGAIECRRGYNKMINAGDIHRIRKYFPVAMVDAVSKQEVRTDDNYKSAVGTNPANGPVIQLHVGSPDETTSTVVHVNYSLTYYCQFMSPKFLGQS